jgi:hypothetical protein
MSAPQLNREMSETCRLIWAICLAIWVFVPVYPVRLVGLLGAILVAQRAVPAVLGRKRRSVLWAGLVTLSPISLVLLWVFHCASDGFWLPLADSSYRWLDATVSGTLSRWCGRDLAKSILNGAVPSFLFGCATCTGFLMGRLGYAMVVTTNTSSETERLTRQRRLKLRTLVIFVMTWGIVFAVIREERAFYKGQYGVFCISPRKGIFQALPDRD